MGFYNCQKLPPFHLFYHQGLLRVLLLFFKSDSFSLLAFRVGFACWTSHSLLALPQKLSFCSSSFSFPSWALHCMEQQRCFFLCSFFHRMQPPLRYFQQWTRKWNNYSLYVMLVLKEHMNRDWLQHARHCINTGQKSVIAPQRFTDFLFWFNRMFITNS